MTGRFPQRFDRKSTAALADWLAVATAMTLPWSTSAVSIGIALWFVALLVSADWPALKRELLTPAGGLPVLLWGLGAVGMLWADVDWHTRLAGFGSFHRLLAIPLLFMQFRRSDRGDLVLAGFLFSATTVLIASYVTALLPALWPVTLPGIPVRDDIFQNAEFLICAFALLGLACDRGRRGAWLWTLGLVVLATLFLADVLAIFTSRIGLLVLPVLAALLGWRELRGRGLVAALVAAALIGALAWYGSPALRARLESSVAELEAYNTSNEATSIGMHTAFVREAIAIVANAPLLGSGTGSILEQFKRITAGGEGVSGLAPDNPHNQTLAVAIQLGIVGAVVLWAMWLAHLWLFRGGVLGRDLAGWIGLVVVSENIVSSLAHSHLFDFANGWLYVLGVGVAGGMALRSKDKAAG